MNKLIVFLCAAFASTALAQNLAPGSAIYSIEQGSKKLGTATYSLQSAPDKYVLTSSGKISEGKFSYSFSNTQKLDTGLNLITDQLSGVVSGKAVTFNLKTDSTGRQFQIDISADGQQKTNTIDRNLNTAQLTDLDPAAYMLLTHIAVRSPAHAWGLVPKENGFVVPLTFTPQPDTKGTLNGQAIDVKYVSTAVNSQNAVTIELFYAPDGTLYEADLPQQNFNIVLDGFHLTHRPTPPAPPHGKAPPPDTEDQQQSQQPQQNQQQGQQPQQ